MCRKFDVDGMRKGVSSRIMTINMNGAAVGSILVQLLRSKTLSSVVSEQLGKCTRLPSKPHYPPQGVEWFTKFVTWFI